MTQDNKTSPVLGKGEQQTHLLDVDSYRVSRMSHGQTASPEAYHVSSQGGEHKKWLTHLRIWATTQINIQFSVQHALSISLCKWKSFFYKITERGSDNKKY